MNRAMGFVSAMASQRHWLAPLLLFFGAVFLLLAAQEGCYQKAVRLKGVVLSKHYSPGTSRVGSSGVSSSSSHKIRYRFTAPDGQVREDFGEMLLSNWSKIQAGDAVDVEYLPATKDSRVAKQTAAAPVFLLMALPLLAGGAYLRRPAKPEVNKES